MSAIPKDNETEMKMGRSVRLKAVRQLLSLTAEDFAKKYGIPLNTLKNWESPSRTTLTESGAMKLSMALKKDGIDCRVSWLLYGQGAEPTQAFADSNIKFTDLTFKEYAEKRSHEVEAFCKQYENAVFLTIEDGAMQPYYYKGDIVGGIWLPRTECTTLDQRPYIIEQENHQLICRQLICREETSFDAVATNQKSQAKPLLLENIKSTQFAPVLRLWANLDITQNN